MNHIKKTCSALAVVALIFTQGLDIGLDTDNESTMQMSRRGLEHIASWEGCKLEAYQCSADVWTLFLGHTEGVKAGDTGTEYDAAVAFVGDIKKRQDIVNRHLNTEVNQPQFDMLVSFTYNLGENNFKTSTLLKRFNQGESACSEFLRWVYVNGKDCRQPESNCAGIVNRRKQEYEICTNGYPDV